MMNMAAPLLSMPIADPILGAMTTRHHSVSWPSVQRTAFWLCLAAVTYLALTPPTHLVDLSGSIRTNLVFAFFALGLLSPAPEEIISGRVLLNLIAYGCAIEVLQAISGTQIPEAIDVVFDAVGLGVAVAMRWAIELLNILLDWEQVG